MSSEFKYAGLEKTAVDPENPSGGYVLWARFKLEAQGPSLYTMAHHLLSDDSPAADMFEQFHITGKDEARAETIRVVFAAIAGNKKILEEIPDRAASMSAEEVLFPTIQLLRAALMKAERVASPHN